MDVIDDWGRKTCISSPGEYSGPLFSNPSDSQLLFSSPSLSPPILSPIPHLTPARFIETYDVTPSASSAIGSSFRVPNPCDEAARVLSYNRLQFLHCPGKNYALVFFPTGTNLDQIGFLLLSTGDSDGFQAIGSDKGDVFVTTERFYSRILKILVQPISDLGAYKCSSSTELGYVMVYTLLSIHWYCVKYDDFQCRPVLRYLGRKQFKSCSIASASWSPHLPGECIILLEKGQVFLFDLNQRHRGFRGCKMKVSWEDQGKKTSNLSWLGCEFGWRLGEFMIARSDAVFLINKSSGNCSVRSLVEVENLNVAGTEEFVGFAKAGSDSFRFIVVSQSYLFLCDQRSGMPLLKWQHDVEKPCFMDVYSSSDLGFRTVDDESTTYCVIVGSFWNGESQMFCYGPSPSVANDPSSLYVWELPHNLLLPARKCLCGDCLIRELRMKESLPEWIDWQKKTVLVLGFGVLNKFLRPPESSEQSSGFTLIRLTSSGKLEALKFCASRDPLESLEEVVAHIDSPCKSEEVNLLYLPDDNEYKLPKRFKYLKLENLSAHTKGTLAELLDSKMRTSEKKSKSFSLTCHEELCEKLKVCGFGRDRSSSRITAVFDNINAPTSVFDIALRETWSSLPVEILLLAFSNYSEFEDVRVDKNTKPSLEFLVVPEFPQLPPFFLRKPSSRSSKLSKKNQQPTVELVGPVLPLPVLLTLHEFHNGCPNSEQEFSPEAEFSNRCNQISKATRQVANSGLKETTVSLGEDDDMWVNKDSQVEKKKPFIAYFPITKTADSEQEELTTFVSRVRRGDDDVVGERAGLEMFDEMSPVEIRFEDRTVNFDTKALLTSMTLLSQWQHRSSSYQDFLSQYHLPN